MYKKLTTEEFIEKAIAVHGDKYGYSLVEYVNNNTKVKIICKEHGVFEQQPTNHLRGKGCPKCIGRHKTTEELIKQFISVHGDKYDYSLVDYVNSTAKVKIICKEHGVFEQRPNNHLNGKGCLKCAGIEKGTTESFKEKAQEVHGDLYDYSLVEYITAFTKVKIICKEHGVFEQTPNNHLTGYGCLKCTGSEKGTAESFKEKAQEVHGDTYDYSLVEYVNNNTKVKLLCKEHGVFEQAPTNHLSGRGCLKCSGSEKGTTENFKEKAQEVHGDRYDYSLVEYITAFTKVKILCKEHGVFEQAPSSHLNGNGCPKCCSSKGEIKVQKFLELIGLSYETQKRFPDCKNKNPLPFDFYLPDCNTCIEYDGEQHFYKNVNSCSHKMFSHKQIIRTIHHDNLKTQFCEENSITLIRIAYDEEDIEGVLERELAPYISKKALDTGEENCYTVYEETT